MKTLKTGLIGLVIGAAVALGTAMVGSEEASAAACCSSCEPAYEDCMAGCFGESSCELWCGRAGLSCHRTCVSNC